MALRLFNGALTNAFQPSIPIEVQGDCVVLDFLLSIANTITPPATGASIEWYPEFTWTDPNAVGTQWYRETAEEDIGNGDVRMALSVRRFSTQGADTPLPPGTHACDVQLKREHAFVRVQIRVAAGGADTCSAAVWAPFGTQLQSAP